LNQFAEAEAQKAKATMKVTFRVRITAHSLPKKRQIARFTRPLKCPFLHYQEFDAENPFEGNVTTFTTTVKF